MNKNKKGVSVMIGYVLLISFAIIISVVVFQQLKGYVPTDSLECPDGVSLFVRDYSYNCSSQMLNLTIKNTGRFAVGGYFIHAANDTLQEVATLDISGNITPSDLHLNPGVRFGLLIQSENSFNPNNESIHRYNIAGGDFNTLTSVELTPIRWQEENNRKRVVSCSEAKIKQTLSCS